MNKAWILMLGMLVAAPSFAQYDEYEEEATEEYPAGDGGYYDSGAEATGVEEEGPGAEMGYGYGDEEAEPEEDGGLPVYIGLEGVNNTVDVAPRQRGVAAEGEEFDTKMYRLRLGTRLSDQVGAELQYGIDNSDDGEAETDSYIGLFIVPTATLFEKVELAFPIGYARYETRNVDSSGASYGLNVELPLRNFVEGMPDVRFTLGYTVYSQEEAARVYGANFGLRWDFNTGNAFAGVGNLFSKLNPFD